MFFLFVVFMNDLPHQYMGVKIAETTHRRLYFRVNRCSATRELYVIIFRGYFAVARYTLVIVVTCTYCLHYVIPKSNKNCKLPVLFVV